MADWCMNMDGMRNAIPFGSHIGLAGHFMSSSRQPVSSTAGAFLRASARKTCAHRGGASSRPPSQRQRHRLVFPLQRRSTRPYAPWSRRRTCTRPLRRSSSSYLRKPQVAPVYLLLSLRRALYAECGVLIRDHIIFVLGVQRLEVVRHENLFVRELVGGLGEFLEEVGVVRGVEVEVGCVGVARLLGY